MSQKPRTFIVGASSGIGFALAKRLSEEYDLILGARHTEKLVTLFPNALILPLDVCQEASLRSAYSSIEKNGGNPSIVIHCVGVGIFKSVLEMSVEEFRQMLETNLLGTFISCQEALRRMKEKQEGTILNISSIAGKIAFGGGSGYNASKFGLSGFSEALMMEAREFGIKVITLFPGSVDTPFHDQSPFKGKTQRSQMLTPEAVADFIATILKLPPDFLCDQIQFRPLKKKGIK